MWHSKAPSIAIGVLRLGLVQLIILSSQAVVAVERGTQAVVARVDYCREVLLSLR